MNYLGYKRRLARLEEIFMAKKGTPEYEEAKRIEKQIGIYEKRKFTGFRDLYYKILFKLKILK